MCMFSQTETGEAKFRLEPKLALAQNHGLGAIDLREAERLIEARQREIVDAWRRHFGS